MFEPETTNVVPFKPRAKAAQHPKTILERVYAAGSLAVGVDDIATKMAARMLQRLGFLVIDAISADGALHRLKIGETRQALDRPWRLSKPAFSGETGMADGEGAFKV